MAGGCHLLFLLHVAATATLTSTAGVSQAQTVRLAAASSVLVECGDAGASVGGSWNLLGLLSDLLLGDAGDDYDDDDDDDDDDVAGSSGGQRAGSEEDDYSWGELGVSEDSGSEEAARPADVTNNSTPGDVTNNSLAGDITNNSLPGDVTDNSVSRRRRAAPSWSLGGIDVWGGRNWSVRVFDWVQVRRNPTTGQVEVKVNMPGLFSPAGGGGGDDEDDDGGSGGSDDDVGYVSRGDDSASASEATAAGGGTPPDGSTDTSQPSDT